MLAGCAASEAPDRATPGVVAIAADDTLTEVGFARLLSGLPQPVSSADALSAAQRWVAYRLLADAAAHGDSLKRPSLIDSVMAPLVDKGAVDQWLDRNRQMPPALDTGEIHRRFEVGIPVVARDIFLAYAPDDSVARRTAIARLAALRDRVTPQTFAQEARRLTDDREARRTGGLLPVLALGEYPPALDSTLRVLPIGGISGVVATRTGAHLVLRVPWREAASEAQVYAVERARASADSAIAARVSDEAQVVLDGAAGLLLQEAFTDVPGSLRDPRTIATWRDGTIRVRDLAVLLHALRPQQLQQLATRALRDEAQALEVATYLTRSYVMARAARRSGTAPDRRSLDGLASQLALDVRDAWRTLGFSPTILADSAQGLAARRQLARQWFERALPRLMADPAAAENVTAALERALHMNGSGYVHAERVVHVARRAARSASGGGPVVPAPDGR